jgi:hypothetical protein
MSALPVIAALVRRVHPLPATAGLSYTCALGVHKPSCTIESTTSSFTLEAHMPQSCGTRGCIRALSNEETGSETAGYVAAPELSLAEMQDLEVWDM